MKERITRLLVLLMTLTLVVLLASCTLPIPGMGGGTGEGTGEEGGGGEGGENNAVEKENLIYNSTSELYFVFGEDVDANEAFNLQNAVDSTRGKLSQIAPIGGEPNKHEIVIGDSDRQVTKTAKSHLERLTAEKFDVRFLIYSDGSSIAIVYDEDERDVAQKAAIQYFSDNFVTSELVAPMKDMYKETFNLVEYYKEIDDENRSEQWAALRKVLPDSYGDEFIIALQQLYSLYSADVVTWFANLYEPNICVCYGLYEKEECEGTKYCGTAGIYYSNSGRDTIGYLPDVESMGQALGFLESSGMSYMFDNKYSRWLPEDMKLRMGKYAQALQDPDGFFYHPQWGKDYIINNNKDSRRARDLGHATGLISLAGLKPFYNTPTGVQGSEDVGTAYQITAPLGNGKVMAVSKVLAVADEKYAEHLESVKTFQEYLDSYDIRNNSYSVGNRIGSQIGQIQARDRVIGTEDNRTPLMDVLMNYLITNQNPETGCWNWQYINQGLEHTGRQLYESVNGLLKIGGQFTSAGVKMPYAKEAAITAMQAIIDPLEIGAVTDLYNTWYAIENTIDNLRKCGGLEGSQEATEIIEMLKEMAVDGIRASTEKIAVFQKMDGSFSYAPTTSATTSQGCPVALPETNEGDVNATVISINGIRNHALGALDLDRYKPILFGEAERLIYLDIIENASSVKKNEVVLVGEPITFDYDEIGEESSELIFDHGAGQGTGYVVEDPTGRDGNVTHLVSYTGTGDYITIPNQSNSALDNTFVFESEFLLDETSFKDGEMFAQFYMGRNNYTCYFFTLSVVNGKIVATEQSATSWASAVVETLGQVGTVGEWFKIKAEYYYTDNMDTVRIKFHYDDDLTDGEDMKVLAVTDNFYDGSGNKYLIGKATPVKYYEYTKLYLMKDGYTSLYMDNCMSYKTKTPYVQESDPNNQPKINVDPPECPEKTYDFADGIDESIITKAGDGAINAFCGVLNLTAAGANGPSLQIPVNHTATGSQCVSVSMDINCASAPASGSLLRLLGKDGTRDMFALDLISRTDSDGTYLTLCGYNGTTSGDVLDTVRIPVGTDETVTLSFDYFHREDMIIIYVDGEFVAASSLMYADGIKYTMDSLSIASLGAAYDITIDNLKVDKNTSLFRDAVAPTTPSAPHTFDSQDSTVSTLGSATVSGGVLTLNSKSGLASVTADIHTRANLQNLVKFSALLKLTDFATKGETHKIVFKDESGEAVFALALVYDGSHVNLCQVSEGGTVSSAIYSYDAKDTIALTLEIYQDHKMVHIIEGGEVKAKTSVFYNPENIDLKIKTVTISSSTVKSTITVDNLLLEDYYGAYIKATISSKAQPDDKIDLGLNFETANSGKLPTTYLTTLLNSPASAIRVERIINTVTNEWSNVLVKDTGKGANDSAIFNTVESVANSSSVVFEADLMFETQYATNLYQVFFADKSRNNKVYMIAFTVDKNGNLIVTENSSNSYQTNIENSIPANIKLGEWFRLRVEFYKGNKETVRFKVYINDTLMIVSDNYYNSKTSGTPNTLLETVQFMALSDAIASVYMDNVTLKGTNATCTDAVTVQNSPNK